LNTRAQRKYHEEIESKIPIPETKVQEIKSKDPNLQQKNVPVSGTVPSIPFDPNILLWVLKPHVTRAHTRSRNRGATNETLDVVRDVLPVYLKCDGKCMICSVKMVLKFDEEETNQKMSKTNSNNLSIDRIKTYPKSLPYVGNFQLTCWKCNQDRVQENILDSLYGMTQMYARCINDPKYRYQQRIDNLGHEIQDLTTKLCRADTKIDVFQRRINALRKSMVNGAIDIEIAYHKWNLLTLKRKRSINPETERRKKQKKLEELKETIRNRRKRQR